MIGIFGSAQLTGTDSLLISISNTNKGYETYANKTHNITLKVRVIEKNMGIDTIENVETIIKVNGQKIQNYQIKIKIVFTLLMKIMKMELKFKFQLHLKRKRLKLLKHQVMIQIQI